MTEVLSAPLRALVGVGVQVPSPPFLALNGYDTSAADSTPTCAVTREDGTSLTAATVATGVDGVYPTTLLAGTHLTRVDRLKLVWSGEVNSVEQSHTAYLDVMGARFASVHELRRRPKIRPEDGGLERFPNERLAEAIAIVEDLVAAETGVSWTPRYGRDDLVGDDSDWLILTNRRPTELIAVTIDGTSKDVADFAIGAGGRLIYKTGSFPVPTNGAPNVSVSYVHGYTQPAPDLRREGLEFAAEMLLGHEGPLSSHVISETVEGTTIRYSTPNPERGRRTGHIGLDAALVAHDHRTPGVA